MLPLERYLSAEPEPYLAVYLHSVSQPNEYNCSASRRISLEVLEGADHRLYTFFIAPGSVPPNRNHRIGRCRGEGGGRRVNVTWPILVTGVWALLNQGTGRLAMTLL